MPYKDPKKNKDCIEKYRNTHKEQIAQNQKEYRKTHRNEINKTFREWTNKNRAEWNKTQRKLSQTRRYNLRMEIIKLLGGKCSNPNCAVPNGMRDWRALQIDHIYGNGHKERQKKSCEMYMRGLLVKIKAGNKEYQLLCANCNWIKKYENNENTKRLTDRND